MPARRPAYSTRSPGAASNSKPRLRALTWMRIALGGLERNVGAEAELARFHAHYAARELRAAAVELHRVDEPRDAVELGGAAVERGAEHLQRRNHFRLRAVDLH